MSSIFTVHRQPYGEVMNPISADGVKFYGKDGDITEVRMVDGMVNIHVGGATVSAEYLEDLIRRMAQSAADGGFTAADMMDARSEGRKEAQQHAPVASVGVEGDAEALEVLRVVTSRAMQDSPTRAAYAHVAARLTQQPLTHGEAVAEVVEAEGFYGVGGWVKQPDDARDVRGLRGIRGLPIGTKLYLAQQSAADGGFTAADMMDARSEGRKEAQQHAPVASVGVDGLLACYQCGNTVTWLAPDSRCGDCTHLTPDEVRG